MSSDTTILGTQHRNQPILLGNSLSQWARDHAARIALVNELGERITYAELHERVERLAGGLYAAGLRAGDHAMMQMPNTFGCIVTFFALLRLGAIPIMTMPNQREQDIDALMALAAPTAYFIPDTAGQQDYLSLAQTMQNRHKSLRLVVMDGHSNGCADVHVLSELQGAPCPWLQYSAQDTALLLLSGGTTGTPKLIPRTHGDYCYNLTASAALYGFNADTVFLAVLPVAHNFTLACPGVLGTLSCGGTVVLSRSASCDEAMPLIEQERVTHVALVPPLAKLWVEGREWEDSDLSSLKVIMVGGARLEAGLAQQLLDTIGCQLQQVFGMAEGLLCYTRLDDPLNTIIHTQGRPLSSDDEVRIVDEHDQDVADGQVGELLTRGPYTIRGYYRADEQNARSFTQDGFYRSGDLVRRDASGNLIVEGRIKEQINRCGEKISAAEVEAALSALHGVHAAVAVGVPDALLGERICAFIKAEENTIHPANIKTALRERGLSDYKVPDQIETITDWPLTAANKIDKRRLAAIAQQRENTSSTPTFQHYLQESLAIASEPLDLAVKLAQRLDEDRYVLYEREGEWSLGVGCAMEITLNADGVIQRSDGQSWQADTPAQTIADALRDLPFDDWHVYGTVDFEFACLTHGVENRFNAGSLSRLTIPRCEIRIQKGRALLRALVADDMTRLKAMLHEADQARPPQCGKPVRLDVRATGGEHYQRQVASAVAEINAHRYRKVILSRTVEVPVTVDMAASYYDGRKSNTPARSFLLKNGEFEAYGFSPETVVTVEA